MKHFGYLSLPPARASATRRDIASDKVKKIRNRNTPDGYLR